MLFRSLFASYREASGDTSPKNVLGLLLKKRAPLFVAHALLAVAYLLWRATLFSTSSLNVYATGPQLGVPQLASQLWAHLQFPLGLVSLAPMAAWVVAVGFVSLIVIAVPNKQTSCVAIGILFLVTVVAAVATYFSVAPGEGDGYRLYYLSTIG